MTLEAPGATFRRTDLDQLQRRGITLEDARHQIEMMLQPPVPLGIDRACTVGDGIVRLSETEHDELLKLHHEAAQTGTCHWFVPASGAASRMFKELVVALAPPVPEKSRKKKPVVENMALKEFLHEIRRFAFYSDLDRALGGKLASLAEAGEHRPILETMLAPTGLGFADKPKGLMPFHAYDGVTCTAFEEHLIEAGPVVRDAGQRSRLHFTVSPEHMDAFQALYERVRGRYELQLGVNFEVGFSVQSPATDTLALDAEGRLFRDEEDMLLFRPGGHGALLENLQALNAHIAFIKNIDNVTTAQRNSPTVLWSRLLIGTLVRAQRKIFDLLRRLESDPGTGPVYEALEFASTALGCEPHAGVVASSAKRARSLAVALLHRPLRVCGMVVNSGEPGGGPYWVRGRDGQVSPQIVEDAQLDRASRTQRKRVSGATHFNPVFMACGLRDLKGEAFDLAGFVDPDAVIVAQKSYNGRELITLERPGLWNGAMAHWNTIFVEVPIEVFNPVKTVNDLLRPEHQASGAR
ncbi:MAG: DUF4301 family protein [Candidatus Eisenbacteria bacterium]|uniref:DUF4301 family protein n=1 Tax=Eiseniibacteriota bacterium TaxID=2212470 RepID=A0A538T405_UNCEI|nr:MAG: DUF4301 family protein [Candidatus Eisenbacteria bacterium]